MGCSLSWIAFKEIDRSTVLARLGREDSGHEATNWSGVMAGASLASGFYVVQLEECYDRLLDPDSLAALSQGGTLIGCQAEEHVMASACFAWHDGKLGWQLMHESSEGIDHLKREGTPPPELTPLQDQAAAQQAGDEDVDYFFSVPIDLAAAVVGFHHDHASRTAFASPSSTFNRLDKVDRT